MDVIGLAAAALKPISDEGTIVQQGWYDESLKRSDQQALVKRIKKLMKENGFLFQEGNDQIETDTGIFINAMRFLILKEAEETEE